MTSPSEVTRLLQELGRGASAHDELLPLVYESLQAIARARFKRERKEHTLQATALVHEAYVRLLGGQPVEWKDRAHFFGVAAEAMRRVLIDYARGHDRQKRGGDAKRVPITALDLARDNDLDAVLELSDAIEELEREDARVARIVRLRFYAGLTVAETAELMELSPRTVAREWEFARARLFELLDG